MTEIEQFLYWQTISIAFLIPVYLALTVTLRDVLGLPFKFFGFKFNVFNYHFFISILVFSAILATAIIEEPYLLLVFWLFGFAGMIGETLFSLVWDSLFPKPFWYYTECTLFGKYTSTLNFFIWATGGMVVLFIKDFFELKYNNPLVNLNIENSLIFFWIIFCALFAFLFAFRFFYTSRVLKQKTLEFSALTYKTYFIFCIPFLIALAFGAICFVLEYVIGKILEIFLGEKFWVYNYNTFDKHHSTALNIIPFALGGFYFWSVYELINNFILV